MGESHGRHLIENQFFEDLFFVLLFLGFGCYFWLIFSLFFSLVKRVIRIEFMRIVIRVWVVLCISKFRLTWHSPHKVAGGAIRLHFGLRRWNNGYFCYFKVSSICICRFITTCLLVDVEWGLAYFVIGLKVVGTQILPLGANFFKSHELTLIFFLEMFSLSFGIRRSCSRVSEGLTLLHYFAWKNGDALRVLFESLLRRRLCFQFCR